MIDYQEQKTLEAICAHHGVTDPELISDLSSLVEWAHQSEAAKHGGPEPVFLLVLESSLGLHTQRHRREQQEAGRGLVAV